MVYHCPRHAWDGSAVTTHTPKGDQQQERARARVEISHHKNLTWIKFNDQLKNVASELEGVQSACARDKAETQLIQIFTMYSLSEPEPPTFSPFANTQ